MDVTPDKQNLDSVFGNTTYYIDFYQRQYKWSDEPVKRLLDDVFYKFNIEFQEHRDNDIPRDKLVEKYSAKPAKEWRPLFYAILNSRIIDYQRKKTLTDRIFAWIDAKKNDEEPELESIASEPLALLEEQFTIEQLELALEGLPTRQQQVFMLRTWQGFSVGETAEILDCSEGSVKTHLSRATQTLVQSINAGNKS